MPSTKRSYKPKRRMRKKRVYRKRKTMRVPRPVVRSGRDAILPIKRKVYIEAKQPNTVSTNGFYLQYNLSIGNFPDHNQYFSVFDYYKVNAIKLELFPRFNSFAGNDTTDTTLPGITNQAGTYVHVCYDNTIPLNPTGVYNVGLLNGFMEQGRIKTFIGNRKITIYYRPRLGRVDQNEQNNGVIVNNSTMPTRWLPCNSNYDATTLYGPQLFFQDYNFNGTFGNAFDIYATFYVMFKGQR